MLPVSSIAENTNFKISRNRHFHSEIVETSPTTLTHNIPEIGRSEENINEKNRACDNFSIVTSYTFRNATNSVQMLLGKHVVVYW